MSNHILCHGNVEMLSEMCVLYAQVCAKLKTSFEECKEVLKTCEEAISR